MKELEKQYNKDVEKAADFSFHRPSYMAGWRAALEWVLNNKAHPNSTSLKSLPLIISEIEEELK